MRMRRDPPHRDANPEPRTKLCGQGGWQGPDPVSPREQPPCWHPLPRHAADEYAPEDGAVIALELDQTRKCRRDRQALGRSRKHAADERVNHTISEFMAEAPPAECRHRFLRSGAAAWNDRFGQQTQAAALRQKIAG